MRPGRLQEAPRRPKTHPRRRKKPARRPKTPPRCDFGGFRVPNWTQVGHPRAAQTHVLLSFCSVGRVPKPTNTLLTDSPNDGLVPRAPTSIHRSASAGSRSEKNFGNIEQIRNKLSLLLLLLLKYCLSVGGLPIRPGQPLRFPGSKNN